MNTDRSNYTLEKISANELSNEQELIKEFTGEVLPRREAEIVWAKIQDHKWYLSESLRRDVGQRVAAIDYIENFYAEELKQKECFDKKLRRALHPLTLAA
jgi:hypothetical protein